MRLLLRSDTQADLHNLDNCRISFKETLRWAEQYKVDAVIDAGDLKEAYSPIHVPVVKFWVAAVKELKRRGIRFIAMLGNHDRISQSSESRNWLDILQAAGAEIVTRPRVKQVGYGGVAFLPFTSDKKEELVWAQRVYNESRIQPDVPVVLIFHTDVLGAKMGAIASKGNSVEDLLMDKYDACFGGHLHQRQRVAENVQYIGSPFCHGWDEANQTKGQVLVEVTGKEVKIKQLKTSIPGWYDLDYIQRKGITPEAGAYIRSRVPVSLKRITQQLKDEEEGIRKSFPDARVFVVPKLKVQEDEEIKLEGTDNEIVEQYVAATWPDGFKSVATQGCAYLSSVLSRVAPAVRGKALRLLSFEGENILSYDKVSFKYSKQGLIVVKGKNEDLPKHSIGSGKTNLLSLLYVVLFGETLRGQKSDAWANERTEGRAWGRLKFLDERGRKIVIERSRRPFSLRLWVNGKDESSGIRGTGKKETQGIIQEITGYDKTLLANAVYIDQTIANGLVFGSKSQRLDLLNKIQNLERYDQAAKLVGKDIEKNNLAKVELERTFDRATQDIEYWESIAAELKEQTKTDWEKRRKLAQREVAKLVSRHAGLATDVVEQVKSELADLQAEKSQLMLRSRELEVGVGAVERELAKANKMIASGKCGYCGQAYLGDTRLTEVKQTITEGKAELKKLELSINTKGIEIKKREGILWTHAESVEQTEIALASARRMLAQAETGAEEEAEQNKKLAGRKEEASKALISSKRILRSTKAALLQCEIDAEMLIYAKQALHRTGIPLYLSSALCPVLNKAAEEYSEIFTGSEQSARFFIEDGDLMVEPINPSGSTNLLGQSGGETSRAGIVAAFAVREVAPKTNLVMLDEPGTGLDAEACKQFAKGIKKLEERFETIILTTHSTAIESMLSGEKTWLVTKKNGISTLTL